MHYLQTWIIFYVVMRRVEAPILNEGSVFLCMLTHLVSFKNQYHSCETVYAERIVFWLYIAYSVLGKPGIAIVCLTIRMCEQKASLCRLFYIQVYTCVHTNNALQESRTLCFCSAGCMHEAETAAQQARTRNARPYISPRTSLADYAA